MIRKPASGRVIRRDEIPVSDGLKAWFDSRSLDYFVLNGTGVNTWVSRAGSMGAVALTQATSTNQPVYTTSVASLGGKPSVTFDGVNDNLGTATASEWVFLHSNAGATIFTVERVDSTGPVDQTAYLTYTLTATDSGIHQYFRAASLTATIGNGSGTLQNNWTNNVVAHYAKDVSRWRAWSYGNGNQTSRVSGSIVTNNDTGGQTPSTATPLVGFRLSRATTALKGHISQVIIYSRVLTTSEIALIAAWANREYGVTV
jgi:hypothetical protein